MIGITHAEATQLEIIQEERILIESEGNLEKKTETGEEQLEMWLKLKDKEETKNFKLWFDLLRMM
jgi:uncharacterized protein YccT (UPF0319 family)